MKLNNKGQGQLFMIILVVGLLFGGLGGLKLGNINPFKSKAGVATQKDEGNKSEYYRDKVKGIEYRSEERYKIQNKASIAGSNTIGAKIGNFIDKSIQLILFVIIGGIILFFVTGINIFKRFAEIAAEAKRYRKALKQTIKAVDVASPKMNGEDKVLKALLAMKQDEDTKNLINEMKNE